MVQRLVQRKSIPRKWIERLSDSPKFQAPDGAKGWQGYFHHMDQTLLPFSVLTFPSMNCSIPSWDKIVPDLGKTLLGQAFTENSGMVGNKQKFTNAGGFEMEARVFQSTNTNLKDVIDVYFKNNRLLTGAVAGVFQVGETVTGATSGVTGIIISILNFVLTLDNITGDFIVGEMITGGQSGATANVISPPISKWNQITENVNPLPRGVHEYYFDEWFDTKELSTIPNSTPGKNLQRMIWVNGYNDPSTKKGLVFSWTGGLALITAVTPTTIVIDPSTTWRSLGFTEDAGGSVYIIVNGVSYTVPISTDLNTNTLNVVSTAGISVGDYAFSRVETDVSPIPFDVCRAYHGYMFYGNWNNKRVFQSNGFNRDYNYLLTNFQALDNDIQINMASVYTDITSQHLYHIVVDSIDPEIEEQAYTSNSTNGLNDARFVHSSPYTANPGVTNVYKVIIVADFTIVVPGAPAYLLGEVVKGNLSTATARIVTMQPNGPNTELGVVMLTGSFQAPETITGQSTSIAAVSSLVFYQNWVQYYKNSVLTLSTSGPVTAFTVPLFNSPPDTVILSDNLDIVFGNYYGHTIGDFWTLTINKGGADTFTWSKDGVIQASLVPMTGGFQPLTDGLQVKWQVKTGHQIGDFWDITAYPSVSRAFDNFYFANNRLVGEGYIYNLATNFWTMDTMEDNLYVNGTYGDWTLINTKILAVSAASTSETLTVDPLKQTGANKVLYPYLTTHMNNELVYITTNKTLDSLSRIVAVEKPQVSYLSDPVKLDFDQSSFIGGRLKYNNKKLFISSPKEGVTHCYDFFRSYWQPIKTFPEVGILSIIGEDLICHSNVRNQSFTMFTSTKGDNGGDYHVEIRTAFTSHGMRWGSKYSNMSFVEGHIQGSPPLVHTVYLEPNGCGGTFPHIINPVICVAPDRAPFGEGSFGSHPFASDVSSPNNYFKELNKAYSPVMEWYFMSLGVSCKTKTHSYDILSLGMNEMSSPTGNQRFINKDNLPTP